MSGRSTRGRPSGSDRARSPPTGWPRRGSGRPAMPDVIAHTDTVPTEPVVPSDRARWGRRRRRPSGAPPPLPRKLGVTGGMWVVLIVLACAGAIVVHSVQPAMRLLDRVDTWWLRILADLRGPWLTHVMRGIDDAGTGWVLTVFALGLVCATMA